MTDHDPPNAPPDAAAAGVAGDVVLLHSPTEDGEGVRVLRARDGKLEVGEVRPLVEGKAIHAEVVRLAPREGNASICDVHTLMPAPKAAALPAGEASTPAHKGLAHKGPAKVTTDAYRDAWDRVFVKAEPGGDKLLN
jgi:hypothetical protein